MPDLAVNETLPALNIIGCGRLAKTLARLWHSRNTLAIKQVLNRTPVSGEAATDFIGAGSAVATAAELGEAEFWLIATDDASIAAIAADLATRSVIRPGDVVFHCSGALASNILAPLQGCGAQVASVHPLHAFSDPVTSVASFPGSYCAVEGDTEALDKVIPIFEQAGGRLIPIESDNKVLYHAASVMGSNFLVTLLDASLKTFAAAGVEPTKAAEILRPITHAMIDSALDSDPIRALTGPIARGDTGIIEKQFAALREKLPELTELYRSLGLGNIRLSEQKGQADPQALGRLEQFLRKN